MKPINGLPPFKRFCVTIGNLPSSYVDSMSYYECLMWLCKYLKDTVIPAVNENAEAVNELINWFNNLDVQDEIDNKLDEMVESGQLQEIISEYLNSTAVFGFDTVADMIASTNLIDGSYARTCGKDTYNDGYGALYKIRTVDNDDVVDGENIIAMTTVNTLVAEKIEYYLEEEVDSIDLTDLVIFGDSWSDPAVTDAIWGNLAGSNLNLTVKNYATNGARMSVGLANQVSTYISDTNANKSKAKYIVILGGLNDYDIEQISASSLAGYIRTAINTLKTNCPQAKIVYVSNCSYPFTYTQSTYWVNVHNILSDTGIVTYNMDGTIGIELWNTANYRHLTQAGQKFMCGNIIACLTGGEIKYYKDHRQFETEKVIFDYSTHRVKDMIFMSALITAKNNTDTNFGFSLPSNNQNLSYGGLFNTQGIIGSGYKLGVCDINNQNVVIVFQSAPNQTKYFITAMFPIV